MIDAPPAICGFTREHARAPDSSIITIDADDVTRFAKMLSALPL